MVLSTTAHQRELAGLETGILTLVTGTRGTRSCQFNLGRDVKSTRT